MERTGGQNLKDLHDLYLRLRETQDAVERGPRQVKARLQIVQQKQADLEALKQKQKTLKMAADQKALQLKSNEAKIIDLKSKLNQASSNKEFDILKNQVAADTMSNSVLEDEILDALDKVDQVQLQCQKAEQELVTAKSEEARVSKEVAAAAAGLQSQIAATQASIAELEKLIPGDISLNYKRLVQTHGAAAFAAVEGSTCTSCYVSIPPQHHVILRTGQIVVCKTCGKLQYVQQEVVTG